MQMIQAHIVAKEISKETINETNHRTINETISETSHETISETSHETCSEGQRTCSNKQRTCPNIFQTIMETCYNTDIESLIIVETSCMGTKIFDTDKYEDVLENADTDNAQKSDTSNFSYQFFHYTVTPLSNEADVRSSLQLQHVPSHCIIHCIQSGRLYVQPRVTWKSVYCKCTVCTNICQFLTFTNETKLGSSAITWRQIV